MHETSQPAQTANDASESPALIRIDGPLTIAVADAWRTRLVTALAGGTGLAVDVSAATEIDVFGIQLLLAARRSAIGQGRMFRVTDDGESLGRVCASTGVDRALF